jgi:hypothetical protein
VQFYLPDDAELVEDEQRLNEARAGADWICGHCETQNKAAETECHGCGNPRDELSKDVNLQEREYAQGETPTAGRARSRTVHPLESAPVRRSSGRFRSILVAAALLGGALLLLRMFPRSIEVEVKQFRWERTLQMLQYEPVAREDWSTPPGAFDVSSFQAVREYRRVFRGYETRTRQVRVQVGTERYVCGQIDRGNGYFEDRYCTRPVYETRNETYQEEVYDQVPVYATKYRYKVLDWVEKPENLLKSAASSHDPQWPAPARSDPKQWKEGAKTEAYYVSVAERNGTLHEEQVGPQFWAGLREGQPLKAKRAWIFGWYYGLDEPGKAQ